MQDGNKERGFLTCTPKVRQKTLGVHFTFFWGNSPFYYLKDIPKEYPETKITKLCTYLRLLFLDFNPFHGIGHNFLRSKFFVGGITFSIFITQSHPCHPVEIENP